MTSGPPHGGAQVEARSRLLPRGHSVHVYERDEALVGRLEGVLRGAADAGHPTIVIATADHARALRDAVGPSRAARIEFLDAHATLEALLVDGWPDPLRFDDVVGKAVGRLAQKGLPVTAFGEMVSILVERGEVDAALALEALWKDLGRRLDFDLLCAYRLKAFAPEGEEEAFRRVLGAHEHVEPAEDFPLAAPEEVRLRRVAELQRHAAALELQAGATRDASLRLRQSEVELGDLVENAAIGIHQVAPDGTILWANRAEAEMLGYKVEEYVGRNIAEFHLDSDVLDDIMACLGRGETLRDRPARLRARDGTTRHVLIHSSGRMEGGRLVATRCFTRDVTDRVHLDEARRAAGQLLEMVSDRFLQVDREWRIQYANPAAVAGQGPTLGRSLWSCFPDLQGTAFEANYRAAMERRERVSFEAQDARTGQWFESTVLPVGDGLWICGRDVTERRRTEDELRIRNRQQAAVARLGQLALSSASAANLFEQAMQDVRSTLGIEFVVILERGAEGATLHPRGWLGWGTEDVPATISLAAPVQAAVSLREGRTILVDDFGVDHRFDQPPAFSVKAVRSGLSIVIPGLGHPFGVLSAHSTKPHRFSPDDVAFLQSVANVLGAAMDRRRTEEELRRHRAHLEDLVEERTRRLAESYRELESFNYSVSHDLRAPLRAIAGLSGLLAQRHGPALPPEARRLVAQVEEEAVRMGTLIQELLDLAQYHRLELQRGDVDLSGIARRVLEGLQGAHPGRAVAWSVEPDIVARGDANLLRVVLENLLGNAWKFTSRSPEARIEVGRVALDAGVGVAVRDNGAGFDMSYRAKLFQPFQRLHGPTEFEGTGIGLATVARIVQRHGGRVWAEGAPGKGATFSFSLPA